MGRSARGPIYFIVDLLLNDLRFKEGVYSYEILRITNVIVGCDGAHLLRKYSHLLVPPSPHPFQSSHIPHTSGQQVTCLTEVDQILRLGRVKFKLVFSVCKPYLWGTEGMNITILVSFYFTVNSIVSKHML